MNCGLVRQEDCRGCDQSRLCSLTAAEPMCHLTKQPIDCSSKQADVIFARLGSIADCCSWTSVSVRPDENLTVNLQSQGIPNTAGKALLRHASCYHRRQSDGPSTHQENCNDCWLTDWLAWSITRIGAIEAFWLGCK